MVHAGVFHADDLFCVAMAKRINPDIEVERVFRVPDVADDVIICDIGGGRYDHHQMDAETRENGEKYAACTLFFRDFWNLLFPNERTAKSFESTYLVPVERTDNGLGHNPLSSFLSSFNPNWDETETSDEKFQQALEATLTVLNTAIRSAEADAKAEAAVSEAVTAAQDGVVVLPQFMPWKSVVCKNEEAKFVVFPSNRGGFNLQAVPPVASSMDFRIKIPAETAEADGCTFVHPAGFMATFESEDQAIEAGKELVNKEG